MRAVHGRCARIALLVFLTGCAVQETKSRLSLEHLTVDAKAPAATLDLLFDPGTPSPRPIILLLGSLKLEEPPEWSLGLLARGFALAAFNVAHPSDPDPSRRAQWLVFDERFAHGYALGASRAAVDAGRVIDFMATRKDLDASRIGWIGTSSTGIPALAAATTEKRIKAVVVFVSTGALDAWFRTWRENGLWVGRTQDIWPETRELLGDVDPVRHAEGLWPAAVLMVSGAEDKVVDPRSTRAFFEAARPAYKGAPDELRFVLYEGHGHNLPADLVRMHAEDWFRRHLTP